MKTILLHGDNIKKIAERLGKFINSSNGRGWKTVRIQSSNNIPEVLKNTSLFGETSFFVLENPTKLRKSDLVWMKKSLRNVDGTMVIVHYGELGKRVIGSLPKADKTEVYTIPKKLWTFLDSFYPGNSRVCMLLLHEVLETEAIELVMALLARHLRDLYLAQISPESLPYQSWRVSKLTKQAVKFEFKTLRDMIGDLARADYSAKSGGLDLVTQLDVLITSTLQ